MGCGRKTGGKNEKSKIVKYQQHMSEIVLIIVTQKIVAYTTQPNEYIRLEK